jgi:Ca-activated chloride channel family protein
MVKIESFVDGNSLVKQIGAITVIAAIAIITAGVRSNDFVSLWLTPDQHGRWLYQQREFSQAMDAFEDPMWKGRAGYAAGRYPDAADVFGRVPTAEGFFNRGNALMLAREYGKAIDAYEQAVVEAPAWSEASDNLKLSRYVLGYIEKSRDASDTGDETEMSADDFKFDNTTDKGLEMVITKESVIELESAEKWMRGVDSKTRDFLRTRFSLEVARDSTQ